MKGISSLVILMTIIIVTNISLLFLKIDNTPDSYVIKSTDVYKTTQYIRKNFINDEIIFLAFEDTEEISSAMLEKIDKFVIMLEKHPEIKHARSVFNVDNITADIEGFKISPLIAESEIKNISKDVISSRLDKSLIFKNLLFSKNHKSFSVIIETTDLEGSFGRLKINQFIQKCIIESGLTPFYKAMAGPLSIDVSEFEMMIKDMSTLIPITVFLGFLLIFIYFPSLLVMGTTLLTLLAVVSFTLSLFVLFKVPFNLIGTMIPSLLTAISIASLLHLYNAISRRIHLGETLQLATINGANDINKPALFSALTTSAGLASLATSEILPTRYFGFFSAIGVMLIYFITIYLIPKILALFQTRHFKTGRGPKIIINKLMFFCLRISIRHVAIILPFTFFLPLAVIPLILNINVENNLIKFFKDNHPIVKSNDYIQENFLGLNNLNILIKKKDNSSLLTLPSLNLIADLQDFIVSNKEVDKATSIVDFLKEMHWAFNGEDPKFRTLPQNPELIEQYLFIYGGDDLFDFTSRDYNEFHMAVSLNVHGTKESTKIINKIKSYIKNSNMDSMQIRLGGTAPVVSYQEHVLIDGQLLSLSTSLLIIFILMIFMWRSLSHSILCIFPNISPIIAIFALMGFLNIWLDMGTSMIASVSVGIAVDDTIHIFHSFRKYIRQGNSPIYALAQTFEHSGRAIINTTVILSVQFGLLMFSSFVPTENFGMLTAFGLITALFYDIVFMPSTLYFLGTHKSLRRIFI